MGHALNIGFALAILASAANPVHAAPPKKASAAPAAKAAAPSVGPALQFEKTPRTRPFLARAHDPGVVLRASRALTVLAVVPGDGGAATGSGGHGGASGHGGAPGRLVAATSQDGGDTFGDPVPVSTSGAEVVGTGENGPRLVLGERGMVALWEQRRPDGGNDLMASGSSMGSQWSPPVRVTDKEGASTNSYAYLHAAPNGDVYAVWLDGRERAKGTLDVYLSRSTDAGKTWEKNVLVAKGACPCCRPVVASDGNGRTWVSWRHVYPGDIRDIAIAASTDGGATFSAPTRVSVDNWKINGCPHTGPAIALVGDALHLSWYSESTGGRAMGLRWSVSRDGGRSFPAPTLLSRGIYDPNHPVLTTTPTGRVLVAFQGRDPKVEDGWGPTRVYVADLTTPASAARGAVMVPGTYGAASYPAAHFDTAGRLWLLWTARKDDGTASVLLTRARERDGGTTTTATAPRN